MGVMRLIFEVLARHHHSLMKIPHPSNHASELPPPHSDSLGRSFTGKRKSKSHPSSSSKRTKKNEKKTKKNEKKIGNIQRFGSLPVQPPGLREATNLEVENAYFEPAHGITELLLLTCSSGMRFSWETVFSMCAEPYERKRVANYNIYTVSVQNLSLQLCTSFSLIPIYAFECCSAISLPMFRGGESTSIDKDQPGGLAHKMQGLALHSTSKKAYCRVGVQANKFSLSMGMDGWMQFVTGESKVRALVCGYLGHYPLIPSCLSMI